MLGKISKQINENNKFRLENKIQVYEIENCKVSTGNKNVFLELPPKLRNLLEEHSKGIGSKKKILMAKKTKDDQTAIMKANLITKNLKNALYQAVKNYFIFGSPTELIKITNFLSKRSGS